MNKPLSSVVFLLSFVAAFVLYFYPLRGELSYWRPMLVFLTVVFWLLAEPHYLGIGFAWLMGLLLDILSASYLGENALAMAICAYLLQLAGKRINNFSVLHQIVVVAVLALCYQMVIVVLGLMAGKSADSWVMLFPIISSVAIWPTLAIVLWTFHKTE